MNDPKSHDPESIQSAPDHSVPPPLPQSPLPSSPPPPDPERIPPKEPVLSGVEDAAWWVFQAVLTGLAWDAIKQVVRQCHRRFGMARVAEIEKEVVEKIRTDETLSDARERELLEEIERLFEDYR